MNLPFYKSLDKTSSLFGIKGSYLYIMIAGILVAVVLGFGIIGAVAGSLIGTLATLAIGALSYLAVMMLQGKYSERVLRKKLVSFSLPDFMVFQPKDICRQARKQRFEDLYKKKNNQ